MNDKTSCFVSILDMVSIDVIGSSIAILQAPSDVDYEKPALLRIDDGPPIPLNVQHEKTKNDVRGLSVVADSYSARKSLGVRDRALHATPHSPPLFYFPRWRPLRFGSQVRRLRRGLRSRRPAVRLAKPRATAVHPSAEEIAG